MPPQVFWVAYRNLPAAARGVADRAFLLLKSNSRHPALHFKKVDNYWSVRAGRQYRALGISVPDGVLWFWIGTHAEYDNMIR